MTSNDKPLWTDTEMAAYQLGMQTERDHQNALSRLVVEAHQQEIARLEAEVSRLRAEQWVPLDYLASDHAELHADEIAVTIGHDDTRLATFAWPEDGAVYAVCRKAEAREDDQLDLPASMPSHNSVPIIIVDRAQYEAMQAQGKQQDADWLTMLRAIAQLDSAEWGEADDGTLLEQFDPWQSLRQLATLRQAARALWSALHERQECAVCGGEGWHWVDSMRLPCACQITAERALDNWEELAKGGGDV